MGNGNQDCFRGFAGSLHSISHRNQMRHAAGGAQGRDVESFADLAPSSPYASRAAPCAALAGMWRELGEKGDPMPAERAKFGQFAEKRRLDRRSDSKHGAKHLSMLDKFGAVIDQSGDLVIHGDSLAVGQRDHRFDLAQDYWLAGAAATHLFGFPHFDQLPAWTRKIGKVSPVRMRRRGNFEKQEATHISQYARIDPILFGQHACRAGELRACRGLTCEK